MGSKRQAVAFNSRNVGWQMCLRILCAFSAGPWQRVSGMAAPMERTELDVMCLPAASTRGVGGGGGGERPALRSLASLAADADAPHGLRGLTEQPTSGTGKEGMEEQGSDPLNGQGSTYTCPTTQAHASRLAFLRGGW